MQQVKLAVVVAVLVAVAGCGVPKEKAAAEAVASGCFECLRQKDFEGALDFYSPKFYQAISRENWREMLERLNAKLGDLQSYRLVGWNFRKHIGTNAGSYWQLQYETKYAKYPGRETLTLYKPLRGGQFLITGHNINSEGLLLE